MPLERAFQKRIRILGVKLLSFYQAQPNFGGSSFFRPAFVRSVRNSVYRLPARFHFDRPQPPIGEKRSSYIVANWLTAVSHPLTEREVFLWPRISR